LLSRLSAGLFPPLTNPKIHLIGGPPQAAKADSKDRAGGSRQPGEGGGRQAKRLEAARQFTASD